MKRFRYAAARPDRTTIRGEVDAESGQAAASLLSGRGLFPLSVEAAPERRTGRRAPADAAATTLRGIAVLVGAGVPLHQAVEAARVAAPGVLRGPLERVQTRLREGASLGASLAAENNLFSPVTIGLVRAGEGGVGFSAALDQAASQLERESAVEGRVRAALAYPVVLALAGIASIAFIVGFVVPRFAELLTDLGQELPVATRILLAASSLTRRFGLTAAAATLALAVLGIHAAARHPVVWHRWLLRVPAVGPVRHGLATARVSRILAALLRTGTPALSSLAVARDGAGDAAIAARLDASRARVAEGLGLAAALQHTDALTESALHVARLGEGSGRLPELLERAATLEEDRAERRLRAMVALLEPTLIVAFAAIVAFVAAALLQTLYSVRP